MLKILLSKTFDQISNNSVQMILGWPSTKAVQNKVHENSTTEKHMDDQTIENIVN